MTSFIHPSRTPPVGPEPEKRDRTKWVGVDPADPSRFRSYVVVVQVKQAQQEVTVPRKCGRLFLCTPMTCASS